MRADAVAVTGPGASLVPGIRRYPIRITAEAVRHYPETGESVHNPWDALKAATNLEGMPFFASHADRTIWGRVVETTPNDEARAWDGTLEVSEKMVPPDFLKKADSGEPLPISWDYQMKSRREDGEFGGTNYNTIGESYVGAGVSFAPFPWVARCSPPKCGANVTDAITITKPVNDAALISLMGDPKEGETMDKETKGQAPKAGEGAANGTETIPTIETKEADPGVAGAETPESEVQKVEVKTTDTKKAPEAKTDVSNQKEETETKEVKTETKTEDKSLKDEAFNKLLAFAEKATPFMEAVDKRLEALEGSDKSRSDAEENAALQIRMDAFDGSLNEAGKALNADAALFKERSDAFAKSEEAYDKWLGEHKHLFDARTEPGVALGVQVQMTYPKAKELTAMSFDKKTAPEQAARSMFPGHTFSWDKQGGS